MIKSLYDCFKHWSQNGSVYIVSDTHFDDNDCKLMDPNWPDPKEHIKVIKAGMKFRKNSTLIHLGDVGDPKYMKWIDVGYKVLITGNHDAGASKYTDYFDEIYTGPLMIADKLILSHEPVDVPWAFNIHGHDHTPGNYGDDLHKNVCSNVIGYGVTNLGDEIKRGILSRVPSIHRITIDRAAGNNDCEGCRWSNTVGGWCDECSRAFKDRFESDHFREGTKVMSDDTISKQNEYVCSFCYEGYKNGIYKFCEKKGIWGFCKFAERRGE